MYINNLQNRTNNQNMSFCAKPIPHINRKFLTTNIEQHDSFDVVPHREPDNDSFASSSVIAQKIANLGKKVRIIVEGGLPEFFKVNNVEIIDPIKTPDIKPSEITFVVDHSDKRRKSHYLKNYFNKAENVIGVDHHIPETLISKGIYIDSESKSASELVYDLANSISPLDEKSLSYIYCGILDDCKKSGLLKIQTKDGKTTYKINDKMPEETKKVIDEIEKKLQPETINKSRKFVDILSNLTPKEQEFRENLFKKIEFTPNKKMAYVVIEPSDKEWHALGQDTERTSPILNDLRQRVIKNDPDDEFISKVKGLKEKLENVRAVAVFYRGKKEINPEKERFKMSIHSKGAEARIVTNELNNQGFTGGGHNDRAGGRCSLQNWENFVSSALKASEQFI